MPDTFTPKEIEAAARVYRDTKHEVGYVDMREYPILAILHYALTTAPVTALRARADAAEAEVERLKKLCAEVVNVAPCFWHPEGRADCPFCKLRARLCAASEGK